MFEIYLEHLSEAFHSQKAGVKQQNKQTFEINIERLSVNFAIKNRRKQQNKQMFEINLEYLFIAFCPYTCLFLIAFFKSLSTLSIIFNFNHFQLQSFSTK